MDLDNNCEGMGNDKSEYLSLTRDTWWQWSQEISLHKIPLNISATRPDFATANPQGIGDKAVAAAIVVVAAAAKGEDEGEDEKEDEDEEGEDEKEDED